MQIRLPELPLPNWDTSQWKRVRSNHKLSMLASEPLRALWTTEFDPWTFEAGHFVYTSNPVWEAAMEEYNRRFDLYQRLVPVSQWGL